MRCQPCCVVVRAAFGTLFALVAAAIAAPQDDVIHVVTGSDGASGLEQTVYLSAAVEFSDLGLSSRLVDYDGSGKLDDLARLGESESARYVFVVKLEPQESQVDMDFILLESGQPRPIAYRERLVPIDLELDRRIAQETRMLLDEHHVNGGDGRHASIDGATRDRIPQEISGRSTEDDPPPPDESTPTPDRLSHGLSVSTQVGGVLLSRVGSAGLPSSTMIAGEASFRSRQLPAGVDIGWRFTAVGLFMSDSAATSRVSTMALAPTARIVVGSLGVVIAEAGLLVGPGILTFHDGQSPDRRGAAFLELLGRISVALTPAVRIGFEGSWFWTVSSADTITGALPAVVVSWAVGPLTPDDRH